MVYYNETKIKNDLAVILISQIKSICEIFYLSVSLLQPILIHFSGKIKNHGCKSETFFRKKDIMPKPRTSSGQKNLISQSLVALRKEHHLSQRDLSRQLQLAGYDMDKNVITRIENNQRYVTDIEILALSHIFGISCDDLIKEKEC